MELDLSIGDGPWPDPDALAALAEPAVAAALAVAAFGRSRVSISLRFADDAEMRALNARFRDQDKPTNVLSWPALALDAPLDPDRAPADPADPPLFLGDVALAYETVSREAAAASKPLESHLAHLIVHGVLHLLGHDHIEEAEATRMEAREREALARLGLPDPYAERTDTRVSDAATASPAPGAGRAPMDMV